MAYGPGESRGVEDEHSSVFLYTSHERPSAKYSSFESSVDEQAGIAIIRSCSSGMALYRCLMRADVPVLGASSSVDFNLGQNVNG